LIESTDGTIWAATGWGALRFSEDDTLLISSPKMVEGLSSISPGVKTLSMGDAVGANLNSNAGIGAGVAGGAMRSGLGVQPLVVWGIVKGGEAEKAGLRVGDRIRTIDGRTATLNELFGAPGSSVALGVERSGSASMEIIVSRSITMQHYVDNSTFDIYEDRSGTLWLGMVDGNIVKFDFLKLGKNDPELWRVFTSDDGLDLNYDPRITGTKDGAIWVVNSDGYSEVNKFDGKEWTHFAVPGFTQTHTSILETQDGTLVVGGFGLRVLRDGTWTALPSSGKDNVWHRIRLLESSDGALWVAGLGQGAARLDYGSSTWVTYEGLSVRCETPKGTLWFRARPGAVSYDGKRWVHYGVDDGLMDRVFGLISTREGEVWASGSHEGTAATARFDGEAWDMMKHFGIPGLQSRSAYQASDGSLWFGGNVGDVGGVLKFDGMEWTHYKPPEAPELTYGIGQMADGTMLFGGYHLRSFDGENWSAVSDPRELTIPFVENVYSGRNGDLWIGTRRYGVFHYDPMLPDDQGWTRYDTRHGLNINDARFFLELDDGSVLVANGGIISRFDGRTWTTDSLPMGLSNDEYVTSLVQAQDGSLFIDMYTFSGDESSSSTVRYVPDTRRPETEMTLSLDEVSQPGNTTLSWKGSDPWKSTPDKEIQFSWRLDEGEWSPYSQAKNEILQSVPSGDHVFEVRARDRDFNVDESPARVDFTVIPPVWQQAWFILMVTGMLGLIGFQTNRVVRRDRRLTEANEALSVANRDLFSANVGLEHDKALERVRSWALAMERSEDIAGVAATLFEEYGQLGFTRWRSGICIVDEEANTLVAWLTQQEGEIAEGKVFSRTDEMSPKFAAGIEAWRRNQSYYVFEMGRDEVEEMLTETEGFQPLPGAEIPDQVVVHWIFFPQGFLFLTLLEELSEADLAVAQRFAEVFGFAYDRYLQLEQAEGQARRAERRALVDRVRAEAMAMQGTEDIAKVVRVLWEALAAQELNFDTLVLQVVDDETDTLQFYLATTQGFFPDSQLAQRGLLNNVDFYTTAVVASEMTEDVSIRDLPAERYKGVSSGRMVEVWDLKELPKDYEARDRMRVPFAYGGIRLISSDDEGFPEEALGVLEQFAGAVSLGFTRFFDFRQLEERNRALAEANEQIQAATQMKSRFLASMSHELRTPMNAIIGFTRLVLRRGQELTDRSRENLDRVKQSADHLLGLINDVLDLSKIEAGRMDVQVSTFALRPLIDSCCTVVNPLITSGVTLRVVVDENIRVVETDEGRLRQIVINLLSNAAKFTDKGEVAIEVLARNHHFEIKVSDTGIGIPEADLDTIFEEFHQVEGTDQERQGTGLGLPITKRLAELLGGTIAVTSTVGEGSTFTVQVPRVYSER
jgi:signal transduction histidine kinase